MEIKIRKVCNKREKKKLIPYKNIQEKENKKNI